MSFLRFRALANAERRCDKSPSRRDKLTRRRHFRIENLEERRVLATAYVGEVADFAVVAEVAPAGLSAGDTVTWNAGGSQHDVGEVTGLQFGANAFTSIQSAVNAANAGDTIYVAAGTYSERLVINKQGIKVIGKDSASTIVDYTGQTSGQAGVYITGANAELWNLAVTHSSPNTSAVPRYGIKADYVTGSSTAPVDGVVIDGVTVTNSFRTGLDLNGVTDVTVRNFSAINNGGAGIFMTDVKGADLSNITTSGNPWAGVSVATFGRFFPLGTSDITFSGTNSFGESATANGGLQLEMGNYINPADPEEISWSNQASDNADVTIQLADFGYMVSGHSFDNANVYRRFYQTFAQAKSAALGSPDHINATSRYLQEADDSNDFGARETEFHVVASPKMSIQAAINAAASGDVIHIGGGIFNENVSLNKSVTLDGAGNGSSAADTVITSPGNILSISADNVAVKDLRATGGAKGIVVSGASGTTLDAIAAVANTSYGVEVTGTTAADLQIVNSILANNSVGFRMGTAANLVGLTIADSTISGNRQGIAVFTTPAGSHLTDVEIRDSLFADNSQKGMYFEKLSNALVDSVTLLNSGVDPTYAFNNGIDINLKHGNYSNIVIQDSTFSGSGVRYVSSPAGLDFAAALAIKARNDGPSYNAVPATLTDVHVRGNVFKDSPENAMTTSVRIGEPGKGNAGPTAVKICGNDLSDGTFIGVDNTSLAAVDAEFNWWGTTSGALIDSALALGNIDFTSWLLDSAFSGNNVVFEGAGGISLVVNKATGQYVFTDSDDATYSGSGARIKNGELKIHDQSSGGKIDVTGSAAGSISVSLKGKGKPATFALALSEPFC